MNYGSKYPNTPYNRTTRGYVYGGHAIWMVSTFDYNPDVPLINFWTFNFSGLPTFRVTTELGAFEVVILVCSPNPSIETVQVEASGQDLVILPVSTPPIGSSTVGQIARGNLDQMGGDVFLTELFSLFKDTGPAKLRTAQRSISDVEASLVFGWEQIEAYNVTTIFEPVVWTPAPISNITRLYSRLLQSAVKPYMAGQLGTLPLPGITLTPAFVFSASFDYVVVSTVLLAVLNVVNLLAYFRSGKGEMFSLFMVARVLLDSNVQKEVARFGRENPELRVREMECAFGAESKHRVLELKRLNEEKEDRVLMVSDHKVL
ncbi:hypothetical protein AX16_005154 [Volvariella volvacea WC 439]|nr:hypothetical protein AX16_005154 [Volvariella volvacea WC 439]